MPSYWRICVCRRSLSRQIYRCERRSQTQAKHQSIIQMGIGYGNFIHYDLPIGRSIVSIIPKFRHNGNQCLNRLLLLGCSNSFMRSDGIYLGRNIYRSHTHTRHAMVNGNSNDMLLCYILQFIPHNGQPCTIARFHLLFGNTWYCAKHPLPTKATFIMRSEECGME